MLSEVKSQHKQLVLATLLQILLYLHVQEKNAQLMSADFHFQISAIEFGHELAIFSHQTLKMLPVNIRETVGNMWMSASM